MFFEFYNPCKVTAGAGCFKQIGEICAKYGKKIFVLSHKSFTKKESLNTLKESFEKNSLDYCIYCRISGEPNQIAVNEAVNKGREYGCEAVLAIGGGSVIDTAKAAAGLIVNGGNITEYLEGVGTGKKMQNNPLPFIAVPTTAGTGAEATKNAVVSGSFTRFKKSFRDERLFAREIVIDPELHVSTPKGVTAYSGMDALTQLIESYTSLKCTPLSEAYALNGLFYVKSLKKAYDEGENTGARYDMSLAALMSGIALSTGGLGAAHGIAAALGANLNFAHGYACAVMLPDVIRLNSCAKSRYSRIAQILCGCNGGEDYNYDCLIDYVKGLNAYFNIPCGLKGFNLDDETLQMLAKDSMGSSMNGNPLTLRQEDIYSFLKSLS